MHTVRSLGGVFSQLNRYFTLKGLIKLGDVYDM